jgi:hypothetical protein
MTLGLATAVKCGDQEAASAAAMVGLPFEDDALKDRSA